MENIGFAVAGEQAVMKYDHAATSFKEALNGSNERCLTSGVLFRRTVVGLPMTEVDQDVVRGWITPRYRERFRRQLDLVRRNLDDAVGSSVDIKSAFRVRYRFRDVTGLDQQFRR